MVNVNKLKGKIVENGMTISEVAERVGIDKSTFYRKLEKQGESFLIKEVHKIVQVLNLSADEASAIFFADKFA